MYEEHGRGLIWDKSGEPFVKPGDWNTYEILAVGSQIRTFINGKSCAVLDDPTGARRGIIAFQLHSGGPTEVRYKDFKIDLNPKPPDRSLSFDPIYPTGSTPAPSGASGWQGSRYSVTPALRCPIDSRTGVTEHRNPCYPLRLSRP